MSGGSIHLHRKVFDHHLFERDEFSPREAWIWMVSEAAWKPHERRVGMNRVCLERGQLAHSLRWMADRLRWSVGRVRRFLEKLEREEMVTVDATRDFTLITIVGYEDYQHPGGESAPADQHGNENASDNTDRHAVGTQKTAELSEKDTTPEHEPAHEAKRAPAKGAEHGAAQNEKTTHEKSTHENPPPRAREAPSDPIEIRQNLTQREMPLFAVVAGPETPPDAVAEAVRLFNEVAERYDLSRCQKITDQRRKALTARLRDCGGLEGWKAALEHFDRSRFLQGQSGRDGWRGADIDFLCRPKRFTKLMEGGYDDRSHQNGTTPSGGRTATSLAAMARAAQGRMGGPDR